MIRAAVAADWPMGFELTVAVVVKQAESDYSDDGQGGKRPLLRPYIAVWRGGLRPAKCQGDAILGEQTRIL